MPRISLVALVLSVACGNEASVRRIKSPPTVTIETPTVDQVFRQGVGALGFSGTVTDSYDGPNTLVATWILDGDEGTEASIGADGTVTLDLDVDELALGPHVITLLGRDRDDEETSVEVPWVLDGALLAPVVTITDPADGTSVQDGYELTFRGEAVDNNTDPADLVFVWTSSIDGVLADPLSADGLSVLFSTLSLGVHQVSLEVTDRDGEVGTDSIEVTVGEIEPDPVAQVGDLVFSELMVNPEVVEDEVGEWVELYNTSSRPINITGYAFGDLGIDSYTITDRAVVAPMDYVVLCASVDPLINGGIPCDVSFIRSTYGGAGSMALGNNGDEVVLSRPDGLIIDQVVYNGEWFNPAAATGLDPAQLDADNNDDETMWCSQTTQTTSGGEAGTPGVQNDPCN